MMNAANYKTLYRYHAFFCTSHVLQYRIVSLWHHYLSALNNNSTFCKAMVRRIYNRMADYFHRNYNRCA